MTADEARILLNKVDEFGLPFDEANLTNEELQQRAEAYAALQKGGETVDRGTIDAKLKRLFDRYKVVDVKDSDKYHNFIADFVTKNRQLPSQGDLRDYGEKNGLRVPIPPLVNMLGDQDAFNEIAQSLQPMDHRLNIKRISDILGSRGEEVRKTEEIDKFLAEAPIEAQQRREGFLAQRSGESQKFLAERVPRQVMEDLNVRGLAEGPDVASEIARRGGQLQSGIESEFRSLAESDAQFFADAAFRIQTAKLNLSEESFRSQIDTERTRGRQEQGRRFQNVEKGLESSFEMDMLGREQERNLRLQQEGINFNSELDKATQRAQNISDIGSATGQIVGTKIATRTSPTKEPIRNDDPYRPNFSRMR